MGLSLPGFVDTALNVGTLGAYGAFKAANSSTDTSKTQADIDKEKALQDQLQQQYNAAQNPTQAPQIHVNANQAATAQGVAQQAGNTVVGSPGYAQAGIANPQQMQTAPQAARPDQVSAWGASAAQLSPARTMNAAQVDPAAQARAQQAQAAQVNAQPQDQLRGAQQSLIGQLQDQAAGRGASAADLQMQQGMDRAIAQQASQAAAAHGTGIAAARRGAAYNVGDLMQQTAAQGGIQRAQETAQARQLLGQVAGEARGQDIGLASTQAGFQQQAGLQNAALGTQVTQGNAQMMNQRADLQAQLQQQAAANNQSAQNTNILQQGQFNQQANMTDAEQHMRAQLANQGANMNNAQFNAGLAGQFGMQANQLGQQNEQFNAGNIQQANMFNSQQGWQQAQLQAQLNQQLGMFNAGQGNAMSQFNAGQANQVGMFDTGQANDMALRQALANQSGVFQQQGLDLQRQQMLLSGMLGNQGQIMGGDQATQAARMADLNRQLAFFGQVTGGGAQLLGMGMGMPPHPSPGGNGNYGTPNFNGGGDAPATPGWTQ